MNKTVFTLKNHFGESLCALLILMAQTDSCVLAAGRVDNKGTVYSLPTQPRLKAAYMLQANAVLLTKQAFDDHVAAQYSLQCGKSDRK